jgi:hypothetical protein
MATGTTAPTTPALGDLLALAGRKTANAYIYLAFEPGQKERWDMLRAAYPASVIGPGSIETQVCLTVELPGLHVIVTFEKVAVADEVRECTHTTTCYLIDGEEI